MYIKGARKGSLPDLKKALSQGADVNLQDVFGESALHKACKAGKLQVVKALLEAGAQTDLITTEFGYTPLHYASREGYQSIIKKLIEAGAKTDAKSTNGETALDIAFDDATKEAFGN